MLRASTSGRLLSLLVLVACQPASSEGDDELGGTGESETSSNDAPAELAWVYQPSGCGHAYGVIHRGREVVVVGSREGQPWIARIDEQGELVWERIQDHSGAYFAIDAGVAATTLVAAGRHALDDGTHGLVESFDDLGDPGPSFSGIGGPGTGILGIASVEQGYAVTGLLDDFDLLLGLVAPSDGALTTWAAPTGSGLAPSIGFGIRAVAGSDVAVCGRQSTGEGGQSWTARFDASGQPLWSKLGPDPGVGAYSDCWGLALGPEQDVFVADYGYPGARLAGLTGSDGSLLWEASEPSTGTQAIDVGPDGTIYVGGWSADPMAEPFRSHEVGERSGWLAAFDRAGTLLWRAPAAMPLSIYALRVHEDGFVTVVGDLEPDSECSRAWIGRFEL